MLQLLTRQYYQTINDKNNKQIKRNDSEQSHQHITEEQMELLWFMIQHHQIHLIM